MNNNISDTDILIGKSVTGNATPDELIRLELWISASGENREYYRKTVNLWEKSKLWISDEQIARDKTGVTLAVSSHLAGQLRRMKRQSLFFKIAAVLAFPLALALSFLYFSTGKNVSAVVPQVCEITSPKGHVSKCVLPDGSEIWINTGSTIHYDASLFNHETREIELNGEAYFEVAKNQGKPFVVKTQAANIHVTGTSFNIKSYSEGEVFETILAEGSIEMELNVPNSQKVKLSPGERAVFHSDRKEIVIDRVEYEIYTAWRNGEILFRDATLNDLIKELERIYEIKFYLKDETLGNFRFRGMFSYNNNLIDALEKVKRTSGIGYYIENKEVWLERKDKAQTNKP